jgi:hypothetical protein
MITCAAIRSILMYSTGPSILLFTPLFGVSGDLPFARSFSLVAVQKES